MQIPPPAPRGSQGTQLSFKEGFVPSCGQGCAGGARAAQGPLRLGDKLPREGNKSSYLHSATGEEGPGGDNRA